MKYMNDEGTRGAEKLSLNPELSSMNFIAKQSRLNSEHPRKWGRLVSLSTKNFSSGVSWRLFKALLGMLLAGRSGRLTRFKGVLHSQTDFVFSGNWS